MLNTSNICIFEGRVVADPTMEVINYNTNQGQKQMKKAKFTLAVDKNLGSKQKQDYKNAGKPTSDFPMFEALGANAEFIEKWGTKGKAIKVVASFESYSYTDKSGNKQYGYKFEVQSVGFTVGGNSTGNNNSGTEQPPVNNNQNSFSTPANGSLW